jgi:ABC-type sugar transport system ATPase subunit
VAEVVLELRSITKDFPGVRALDGVSFDLRRGEIHALCGENGAGKSTLMKVLSGVHPTGSYGGEIRLRGNPVHFRTLHAAEEHGIALIAQELALVPELSVAENLVLGRLPTRAGLVRWDAVRAEARRALDLVGLEVDEARPVKELGIGQQQMVEIAKALAKDAEVLVLDEPTAALTEADARRLLEFLRTLRARGVSMIYISHRLEEVFAIADRVTVLRDGKLAASASMAEVSDEQIVEFIVGPAKSRELHEHGGQFHLERDVDRAGPPQLVVSGLVGDRVRGLDFEVAPGEIVGLAGLLGSGAEEVPYLLFGAQRASAGTLRLKGRDVDLTRQQPASAVGLGLSFIPADRNRDGIAREIEIDRNMMALVLRRFSTGGRLRNRRVRSVSEERAEEFDVRPRRTDLQAATLSGGNAQKVVLAKWLETNPAVLLLHEPTQGVDIAARAQIYRKIIAAADSGMSVVWVSSDFEELATTCTRVLVLNNGRATSEMLGRELTPESITARVFAGQQDADAVSRPTEVTTT